MKVDGDGALAKKRLDPLARLSAALSLLVAPPSRGLQLRLAAATSAAAAAASRTSLPPPLLISCSMSDDEEDDDDEEEKPEPLLFPRAGATVSARGSVSEVSAPYAASASASVKEEDGGEEKMIKMDPEVAALAAEAEAEVSSALLAGEEAAAAAEEKEKKSDDDVPFSPFPPLFAVSSLRCPDVEGAVVVVLRSRCSSSAALPAWATLGIRVRPKRRKEGKGSGGAAAVGAAKPKSKSSSFSSLSEEEDEEEPIDVLLDASAPGYWDPTAAAARASLAAAAPRTAGEAAMAWARALVEEAVPG